MERLALGGVAVSSGVHALIAFLIVKYSSNALLHDINQAIYYADHIVVMNNGKVISKGTPEKILTPSLLRDVFGVKARVYPEKETGLSFVSL